MPRQRRPVFRVCVVFGGRSNPREYAFEAGSARQAMTFGLRKARADELDQPHEIAAVIHLCDLDQVPLAKRSARRLRRAG